MVIIGRLSSSIESKKFCSSLSLLIVEQHQHCEISPKLFSIISHRLRMTVDECQYQFRNQRWNCSLFDPPEIFGKLLLRSKLKSITQQKKETNKLKNVIIR